MFRSLVFLILFSISAYAQRGKQDTGKYNTGLSGDLHDVFFINDNTGWSYTYGTGIIYFTKNGARQWHRLAQLDSVYFEQMQFLNSRKGFICGEKGKIYRTTDGGDTWKFCGLENKPDENFLLYAMMFINSKEGIVAGMRVSNDRKKINFEGYRTDDSGTNWKQITDFPQTMFMKFIKVGASRGYAGSSHSIYEFDLKENHFRRIFFDVEKKTGDIRAIQYLEPQLIVAAGYNGYFIKSVDGGKTWMHTKVADEKVRDLYFSSHSNGWIVGNRGTLLYTIDGGVTWVKKENINEDLHRLKSGKKFLYVVGKNATVLRIRK